MEKIRIIVFALFLGVAGLLVFTLSKSWFILDRGIRVEKEPEKSEKETKVVPKKPENHLDSARIVWGNYLFYAVNPEKKTGGYGPDEIMLRAENLVFINIKTGNRKKLFKNNVYIHDFFPGTFTRKIERRGAEPDLESVEIGQKFVIIAVENDTNEDGFLNGNDLKKVYIYSPETESIVNILPANYYFEDLYYNSAKNNLTMVVIKYIKPLKTESEEKTKSKLVEPATDEEKQFLFLYNAATNKGKLINPSF